MLEVLRMVHEELQITTIHVTHDRQEAWQVGQSCAVMSEGRLCQVGPVSEVFRKPSTLFVAEFLGGTNIFGASFHDGSATLPWATIPIANEPAGKDGWVLIRPELIRVRLAGESAKGVAGNGMVRAVVTGAHDLGEYLQLEARTADEAVFTVYSAVGPRSGLAVGEPVLLDWPEEAVHSFHERTWARSA
jgi:ABC-type Fe3+/spermidine/putrescine transport system ATPase subunit